MEYRRVLDVKHPLLRVAGGDDLVQGCVFQPARLAFGAEVRDRYAGAHCVLLRQLEQGEAIPEPVAG